MEQKTIRPWNNDQYSAVEGAELIKELDDRTKSDLEGYNSIAELAAKVKGLEEGGGVGILRKEGYRWIKGEDNTDLEEWEAGDEGIGVGTFYPDYVVHFYVKTVPITDIETDIIIISSSPL